MLTAAQQKVKQELEELKANGQYHRPADEIIPPTKTPTLKKHVFSMIGIGFILLSFAIFVSRGSSMNQEMFNEFLMKEQEYNQASIQLAATVDAVAVHLDTSNLQQVTKKHTELLMKVKEMPVPPELKAHKKDFIRVVDQRESILSSLIGTKKVDQTQMNKFLLELDIKQELAMESLVKAFDQEEIEYLVNDDGTIQYWINNESYQFSW